MELIEEWRPVVGYETRYEVSNIGRVRSLAGRHGPYPAPRVLQPGRTNGYPYVNLLLRGIQKTHCIHRLVARAFCFGYSPGMHVNHKNGVRHDNRVQNLEWVTPTENQRHSWRELGRKGTATGKTGAAHNRSRAVTVMTPAGSVLYFGSQREAARSLGVNQASISACITGRQKQVRGYLIYRSKSGGQDE